MLLNFNKTSIRFYKYQWPKKINKFKPTLRESEDILEYSRLEYVIQVSNMVEYASLKIVRGFSLKYTLHLSYSYIENNGEPLLNEFYERK